MLVATQDEGGEGKCAKGNAIKLQLSGEHNIVAHMTGRKRWVQVGGSSVGYCGAEPGGGQYDWHGGSLRVPMGTPIAV